MKVIIAGTRTITDFSLVERAIADSGFEITEVVSGACRGVDRLGEQWAAENDIPCMRFPAPWDDLDHPEDEIGVNSVGGFYWKKAGFHRNQRMADYADALIAIMHLGSVGTSDMIERALDNNLQIYVARV